MTTFVTNGTFTPPAGVTKVVVECWGGGGSGGTRTSNGQGGGGGGGAYVRSSLSVTPLTSYTVNVGAGSSSSAPGGDSWFGTASTVMAKGGNSSADNSATGATGGTAAASIGTFKYDGATGANGGSFIVSWGGGGGSSAGFAAAGAGGSLGTGGTAPSGGGNGGNGASSQGNGTNGSDPGGGGGGAIRSNSGTRTGGTGGGGKVVVTYYANGTCISGTNGFNSIPDNGCSASLSMVAPMSFSGLPNTLGTSPGNARLYTVELIVAHTYNQDLRISLTSPGGTTRNLVTNRFGSGDNFGNPGTCPNTVFTLRDGGTTLSNSNTNNVSGTYNPEQSLAGFTGNPNGTWTLTICDNAGGDVGNLVYAKLNFCTVPQITAPTSNSPLCAGNALTLGATITGTPTPTLSWAGTGTFAPNNTSANVSVTGPATGNYTLTATSTCGTTNATIPVTVNPLPTVTCPGNSSVCISAPAYALTGGSPAGGTYSGAGVSGGNFNPASAGTGPKVITYSYTNGNGCTNSCSFTITVNPLPTVTCPGNSSVCISAPAYALTGGSPAGGTYSGTGVSGGNFNPASAGTGPKVITYSYTNGNGCTNSCSFTITVNPLPVVTCPGNSSVCISAPAYALTGGSPAGGTYTGAGVSGGNFDPASAGAGAHTITYSYTDGNSCSASCTFTITVNPLPVVTCPGNSNVCISAPAYALTGGSPAGGTYSGAGVSGGNFDPATAGAGAHAITYSYTDGNSCSASCTFTITVNPLPVVTCPGNMTGIVTTDAAFALSGHGESPAGGSFSGTGVSGGNFSPATAGAGVHTITYSYTDGNGCGNSCTFSITVMPPCSGNQVVMSITTDNNAAQLGWEFVDGSNNSIASGSLTNAQNNSTVTQTVCLSFNPGPACYGFKLTDSFGDGITNGGWELRTTAGKVILRDSFSSGNMSPANPPATAGYGSAHSFCLPLGPANIETARCGVFNYALGNKIFCNKITGATQYEFEFTDPDAGFMRRVLKTTNYVQFWDMVVNPLTPGVKYFVRVRSDKDGPLANAYWGSGCEVGLGVAETVLCSALIPAPLYGHSCSEERTFNTNNSFIYATPVTGATEYQFRIYNVSEGYDQTFTRSTYILQLKWNNLVAPPLVDGYTYNVQINVKVNGLYSGFCASNCTIIINNNPQIGPRIVEQPAGTTTLWPNPASEGQVHLVIDGIHNDGRRIAVDITDIYGQQVFTREFDNSSDRFSTVLQLPDGTASGVYLVGVTVNGQRSVHRLSIVK
ncbi:MAG: proprotein convertase P-domain-containing protein [Bacteroidetes bacterium]|nr:proprotein convertase P-domain-containing protein [Bacteroidota bacterium]